MGQTMATVSSAQLIERASRLALVSAPALVLLARLSLRPPAQRYQIPGVWRIGTCTIEGRTLHVGFARDRNAERECGQLIFGSNHGIGAKKSTLRDQGYVLWEQQGAQWLLRGMHVNKQSRGAGYSRVLLAVWLWVCLELKIHPSSCLIHKPLIALGLARFGFEPRDPRSATRLMVAPGPAGAIGLWADEPEKLRSVISNRTLKSQNMCLLKEEPVDGREVWIGAEYGIRMNQIGDLRAHVKQVLDGANAELNVSGAYNSFCNSTHR